MALIIRLGTHELLVDVTCFGARGDVKKSDTRWEVRLSDGVGSGVFLLTHEHADGAFFAHLGRDIGWRQVFFAPEQQQMALEDSDGTLDVILQLHPKGTPIPNTIKGRDGQWGVAYSQSPVLWVTVNQKG